jgi:hypothetical protein
MEHLADRVQKTGFKETKASIASKLKRGDIPGHILSGLSCRVGIRRRGAGGDLVSRQNKSVIGVRSFGGIFAESSSKY